MSDYGGRRKQRVAIRSGTASNFEIRQYEVSQKRKMEDRIEIVSRLYCTQRQALLAHTAIKYRIQTQKRKRCKALEDYGNPAGQTMHPLSFRNLVPDQRHPSCIYV